MEEIRPFVRVNKCIQQNSSLFGRKDSSSPLLYHRSLVAHAHLIVRHLKLQGFPPEPRNAMDSHGCLAELRDLFKYSTQLLEQAAIEQRTNDVQSNDDAAAADTVASPPKQPAEGGPPKANRRKGISRNEAEIRVRDYLATNAPKDPYAITRDGIAEATGVSNGQVSKTSAWKALKENLKANKKMKLREISLTERMQAVIPIDEDDDSAELEALIQEQQADEAEQTRRHKRRHTPS